MYRRNKIQYKKIYIPCTSKGYSLKPTTCSVDGTGNFIYNTLGYDILEQNNSFSGTKMDVTVGFVALCGIHTI